jgi:minimal PKS acyl carrier protein
MTTMTIDDLRQILDTCAGRDDAVADRDDISDVAFEELGYDSLALLETAARIEHRFGVTIADGEVNEVSTPRELLGLVNDQLAAA